MTRIELNIRALAPGDGKAMSALHTACFASPWSEAAMIDLLADSYTLGAGVFEPPAMVEGKSGPGLLGFFLLRIVANEAEIVTLAVRPDVRRTGIARTLLEKMIVSAKASNAGALYLEVAETNPAARELYESFGFVEIDRRAGYYQSRDGADALVLKREL